MKYKLSDIFNIKELQKLSESFTKLTGAVTAILDLEGNVLTASGWQELCTNFHRINPLTAERCRESDTVLAGKLKTGEEFNVYRCQNGLVDVAVPIVIGGTHVGNLFTGQFFFELPDKEYFIRQAEKYGFDKQLYMEALNKVPIFTEEHIKVLMEFLLQLAHLLGEMGLSKKRVLDKSEDKIRMQSEIVTNIEEGAILIKASDSTIVFVNPKFNNIFGYEEGELIGRNVSMLNAADDMSPDDTAKLIIPSLNETGLWQGEILNIKKDGTTFWCHATVSSFEHSEYGTVWVSIHQDITKRKELEKIIIKGKKFSESIINTLPGLFYLLDSNGKFMLWNKNVELVTGYTHDEILKMEPTDFFTGASREYIIDAIQTVFKYGESFVDANLHTKDGRDVPYYFTGTLIEIDGKRCLTGVGTDISERVRLEEQLKQAAVTLEKRVKEEVEKNRLKDNMMYEQSRHVAMGELLVNIAHQWRQPLAAIGILVQDLKDAYNYNELSGQYLDKNIASVMSELIGLSNTIDGFKDFYLSNLQKEEVNVKDIMNNALEVSGICLGAQDIVIERAFEEKLTINVVPGEFAQIIVNLLANVKDVFEQRQISNRFVKINSYKEPETGKSVITIADNGGGVQKDIIGRIFEPYFTTKDKTRGTGLSLYITKLIVEKSMKGTITVKNVNGGAEFRIEI